MSADDVRAYLRVFFCLTFDERRETCPILCRGSFSCGCTSAPEVLVRRSSHRISTHGARTAPLLLPVTRLGWLLYRMINRIIMPQIVFGMRARDIEVIANPCLEFIPPSM